MAISESVIIDFGAQLSCLKHNSFFYIDLSPSGSYTEAINRLYDDLRIAEM